MPAKQFIAQPKPRTRELSRAIEHARSSSPPTSAERCPSVKTATKTASLKICFGTAYATHVALLQAPPHPHRIPSPTLFVSHHSPSSVPAPPPNTTKYHDASSNSLVHLLAKCPLLREIKAWGIRFAPAGSLGGDPAVSRLQRQGGRGGDGGLSSPDTASASALRRAFQTRGVDLAWAGPLLPAGLEREGGVKNRHSCGGRDDGTEEGGVQCGGGNPCVAERAGVAAVGMGEDGRHPCRLGCGARLKTEDAVDHMEVRDVRVTRGVN